MHFRLPLFALLAASMSGQALAASEMDDYSGLAAASSESSLLKRAMSDQSSHSTAMKKTSTQPHSSGKPKKTTTSSAKSVKQTKPAKSGSAGKSATTTSHTLSNVGYTPAESSAASKAMWSLLSVESTQPIQTSFPTTLPGQVEFKAYSDSACKNQIHPTFQMDNLSQGKMYIQKSQDGWPNAKTFENPKFPGASSKGSTGSVVFWDVPAPDNDCRYVLLQDWPGDGSYGKLGLPQGYGMTVLDVGSAGCFYSSFPEGQNAFFWSFCCGGDCSNYAAGATELIQKRDINVTTPSEETNYVNGGSFAGRAAAMVKNTVEERAEDAKVKTEAAKEPSKTASKTPLSDPTSKPANKGKEGSTEPSKNGDSSKVTTDTESNKDSMPATPSVGPAGISSTGNPDFSKCKLVSKQGPWQTAGQQIAVGASTNCPSSGTCSYSAAKGTMKATTMSSSSTSTITTGTSGSVAVKVGEDFIEEADVTTTIGWDFSKAVAKMTGQSVTATASFTFTNQLSPYPGTNSMVTYIPAYECYTVVVNCGGNNSPSMDLCTATEGQGTYQILTMDD